MKSTQKKLTVAGVLGSAALTLTFFACSHASKDLAWRIYKSKDVDMAKTVKTANGRSLASDDASKVITVQNKFHLYNKRYANVYKSVTVFRGIDNLKVTVQVLVDDSIKCTMNGSTGKIIDDGGYASNEKKADANGEYVNVRSAVRQPKYFREFLVSDHTETVECQNDSNDQEIYTLLALYSVPKMELQHDDIKGNDYKKLVELMKTFSNTGPISTPEERLAFMRAITSLKKDYNFAQSISLIVRPGSNGGFVVMKDEKAKVLDEKTGEEKELAAVMGQVEDADTYKSGFTYIKNDIVLIDDYTGGELSYSKTVKGGKRQTSTKIIYSGLRERSKAAPFPKESLYRLVCQEYRTPTSGGQGNSSYATIIGDQANPNNEDNPLGLRRGTLFNIIKCYVNAPGAEVKKGNIAGEFIVRLSYFPFEETKKLIQGTIEKTEEQRKVAESLRNKTLHDDLWNMGVSLLKDNAGLDIDYNDAKIREKTTEEKIARALEEERKRLAETYDSALSEQDSALKKARQNADALQAELEARNAAAESNKQMSRDEEAKWLDKLFSAALPEKTVQTFYPYAVKFHFSAVKTDPRKSEADDFGASAQVHLDAIITDISPIYCSKDFMVANQRDGKPVFWSGPIKYKPSLFNDPVTGRSLTRFPTGSDPKRLIANNPDYTDYIVYAHSSVFSTMLKDLSRVLEEKKKRDEKILVSDYLNVINRYANKSSDFKPDYRLCDYIKDRQQSIELTFSRDVSSTNFVYKAYPWKDDSDYAYSGGIVQRTAYSPARIEVTYVPNVSNDADSEVKNLKVTRSINAGTNEAALHSFFACGDVKSKTVYKDSDYGDKPIHTGTLFPSLDPRTGLVIPSEPSLPVVDRDGKVNPTAACSKKK